jgi:hypothetical protein
MHRIISCTKYFNGECWFCILRSKTDMSILIIIDWKRWQFVRVSIILYTQKTLNTWTFQSILQYIAILLYFWSGESRQYLTVILQDRAEYRIARSSRITVLLFNTSTTKHNFYSETLFVYMNEWHLCLDFGAFVQCSIKMQNKFTARGCAHKILKKLLRVFSGKCFSRFLLTTF